MRPEDQQTSRGGSPLLPQRDVSITPPQRTTQPGPQEAAAQIVRSQLDSIYNGNTSTPTPQTTPIQQTISVTQQPQATELAATNPYERTHSENPQPQAEQWQQYHSAWQTYYQKYYEGYYTHHVNQAKTAISEQLTAQQTETSNEPEELTKDEALSDLRSKLIEKVQTSAKKVRKSRHFVPITAALIVVLLFVFLQYNRTFIATVQAYVSPGSIDPQNIVVDPTADTTVGPENRLIIPKINVDVPTIYDIGSDYNSQMAAMVNGVANFAIPGANSRPGQVGNTAFAGHSSNDILDSGDYKFIFAKLDKLAVGDTIYINYQSKRYTYTVTKMEVVLPTEVSKLVYPTDKPILTLITCTPLGTALKRLLVTAEQISPDPTASTPAPATNTSENEAAIPGNSPTLLQRIFGGGGSN